MNGCMLPHERRLVLELAALAYEQAGDRAARPAVRIRAAHSDVEWIVVDQVDVAGKRYVLAERREEPRSGVDRLTPRERQVLTFLARGDTTKLVAYELGIADATVRVLLVRAVKKLGARDRREAVARFAEAMRSDEPMVASAG
jgi:DNA-binding CsgD family transcriptional regulator